MTATLLPEIEVQYAQARRWAQWFREAGYEVYFRYTGEAEPFDREWQVQTHYGMPIGSIDIDGCGASWHGEDHTWLAVIGPCEGVSA